MIMETRKCTVCGKEKPLSEINGKWENIIDVSGHFLRTDKFYDL